MNLTNQNDDACETAVDRTRLDRIKDRMAFEGDFGNDRFSFNEEEEEKN
jgi:hypothetical protein